MKKLSLESYLVCLKLNFLLFLAGDENSRFFDRWNRRIFFEAGALFLETLCCITVITHYLTCGKTTKLCCRQILIGGRQQISLSVSGGEWRPIFFSYASGWMLGCPLCNPQSRIVLFSDWSFIFFIFFLVKSDMISVHLVPAMGDL